MNEKSPYKPVLQSWTISDLTIKGLVIKLNFSNELYVSSNYEPDVLEVKVVQDNSLKSHDNRYLSKNFNITAFLP